MICEILHEAGEPDCGAFYYVSDQVTRICDVLQLCNLSDYKGHKELYYHIYLI